MKEEKKPEVTAKDVLEIGLKPVVRETHDAEKGSVTIEQNGVVNCVECSTEVERMIDWLIDCLVINRNTYTSICANCRGRTAHAS